VHTLEDPPLCHSLVHVVLVLSTIFLFWIICENKGGVVGTAYSEARQFSQSQGWNKQEQGGDLVLVQAHVSSFLQAQQALKALVIGHKPSESKAS
jgi:hypothetical protein